MSIFDEADSIAARVQAEKDAELARIKEEESERQAEKQKLSNQVIKLLALELNGNRGFGVSYPPSVDQWGTIAEIIPPANYYHPRWYVMVKWVTYQFKGADDVPEQDVTELRVTMNYIKNGNNPFFLGTDIPSIRRKLGQIIGDRSWASMR